MQSTVIHASRFGKPTGRVLLAVVAIAACGCEDRPTELKQYIPPPGPARAALTAILDAWRDGKPIEAGAGPNGDIFVVDKQRKAGQKLVGYDVVGEVTSDGGRGFAVRLTLANPDETPVVRYVVVGNQPPWVFRQEDFASIAHWVHPMDEVKAATP